MFCLKQPGQASVFSFAWEMRPDGHILMHRSHQRIHVSAAPSLSRIWLPLLQAAARALMMIKWPREQTVQISATRSEDLAFPECFRLCFATGLRRDRTGRGRRGEGRGRRGRRRSRGVEGRWWHHQKALAHTQYWESAIHSLCTEQRRGRGSTNERKSVEMKLRRLSAWGRERNGVATALAGNDKLFQRECEINM